MCRRTKSRIRQAGGPQIYTALQRSENNQESLVQDSVYSAVQESSLITVTGNIIICILSGEYIKSQCQSTLQGFR